MSNPMWVPPDDPRGVTEEMALLASLLLAGEFGCMVLEEPKEVVDIVLVRDGVAATFANGMTVRLPISTIGKLADFYVSMAQQP